MKLTDKEFIDELRAKRLIVLEFMNDAIKAFGKATGQPPSSVIVIFEIEDFKVAKGYNSKYLLKMHNNYIGYNLRFTDKQIANADKRDKITKKITFRTNKLLRKGKNTEAE